MTSRTSGALVYWNAHTGFGEIDFDDGYGRVGIHRADLLRAGVRTPQVGDRFHFNTGVAVNGVMTAMDLCPDIGEPTRGIETMRLRPGIQAQTGPKCPEYPDDQPATKIPS
jgi:cold shock CspA family protein